jgi:putative glutamine amidotransferase
VQASLALPGGFGFGFEMRGLATWIQQYDEPLFARFHGRHPDICISNARRGPVDLAAARGVMITGGADIAPQFHVEPPREPWLIRNAKPERDAWEIAAVRFACERRLPLLCICKGVQVLNVALGGTLLMDIPGHDLPGMKSANMQPLRFAAGVRHRFEKVNSSHHQALDRVADALEVEAWHAGDGIIEQVRIRDYPWGIGVQYHPERDVTYASLFDDFFAQLAH